MKDFFLTHERYGSSLRRYSPSLPTGDKLGTGWPVQTKREYNVSEVWYRLDAR